MEQHRGDLSHGERMSNKDRANLWARILAVLGFAGVLVFFWSAQMYYALVFVPDRYGFVGPDDAGRADKWWEFVSSPAGFLLHLGLVICLAACAFSLVLAVRGVRTSSTKSEPSSTRAPSAHAPEPVGILAGLNIAAIAIFLLVVWVSSIGASGWFPAAAVVQLLPIILLMLVLRSVSRKARYVGRQCTAVGASGLLLTAGAWLPFLLWNGVLLVILVDLARLLL